MDPLLKSGFGMGGVIARTLPTFVPTEASIPESVNKIEEKWMARALLEAMNGVGWAAPNPSVGCVIVQHGKILASGFTQNYGGKHAERMAFESLQQKFEVDRLSDLEVYVTLEPCSHTGKQPPCVELLLHSAVQSVWVGCGDPNPLVSGEGIQKLKNAGKNVTVGVLEPECRAWHQPFLNSHMRKKPLWVGKWAENQDGLLADEQGHSKWITNSQSRAYTHWLRQKYDVILVGAGTWLKDQPQLTVRDCAEPHRRNPVVIVHDPKNQLPQLSPSDRYRVFKEESVEELVDAVERADFGFELQSIFCEGGARTLNELLRIDRIDVIHRFVGRKEFGASKHRITTFQPETSGSPWRKISESTFANDSLQEWAKWS